MMSLSMDERRIVTAWLAGADFGVSSRSLGFAALGIAHDQIYHPLDPGDLGRCLRLIARCPAVRGAVDVLAQRSPWWERLAEHWDQLAAMFVNEVGLNWEKGQSAPETYDRMQQLLYQTAKGGA